MSEHSVSLPSGETLTWDGDRLRPFQEELQTLGAAIPVRKAWAAAHVVMCASYADAGHSLERPGPAAEIAAHLDWDATLGLRRDLISHGFGIAEAMDTAQRFFLGWDSARRLIEGTAALEAPLPFLAGASSDHAEDPLSLEELSAAVAYQANFIAEAGGIPLILPMPALSRGKCPAPEYVTVYRDILQQVQAPVYIHWLGTMFLPELAGYFPYDSFLQVMALDREKILGVKMSLLDPAFEVATRNVLRPHGQEVLTGDDLYFGELIAGDADGFSHALLGILDGIALPAGLALKFLAHGQVDRFRELIDPCQQLSRAVFEKPTERYKAGLAFLAWLDGRQENSMLIHRQDRARNRDHLLRIAVLAAQAGAFAHPDCVTQRLSAWLAAE